MRSAGVTPKYEAITFLVQKTLPITRNSDSLNFSILQFQPFEEDLLHQFDLYIL